jgi:hypothetical protein
MNKKQLIVAWVMGVFLLSGCGYTNINLVKIDEPIVKTKRFAVSFDNAWKELLKFISNSGGSIKTTDKDSGIISFEKFLNWQEVNKYTIIPHGVALVSPSQVADIDFILTKEENNIIELKISAKIIGTGKTWGSITQYVYDIELKSTGVLEKEYMEKIEKIFPPA